ncbi:hypothetical protein IEQ34_022679 [Dendrobium chrysotoxum]|uniref:t-SNARE coiled-coil homology domain-containing protein n=1 Tax=Dendrobium chrysotoxum TaxID=161865 RepID=A0AAV7FZQ1_DENCH|nr:hypothetical protein IEQ34_022679 [Dendrobium chrysotoxum]
MSVIDILTRVDSICKKYDKYDVDKQRGDAGNFASDDAFARLYSSVEADIEAALSKSELASQEKNRAAVVAMNAEIRRTKAKLLEEVPKLQRLAYKKVKGLTKEDLAARNDMFNLFFFIFFLDGSFDANYFQQTEESNKFRQEFEMRKMKQDQGLDTIAEGLDTLKNMAHDMNEELDRQVPLIDEIDTKVDRANADLKNTNVRLKDTINQLRSSRNFCIDIILLCIILGIAAYLYKLHLGRLSYCFLKQLSSIKI